MQFRKQRTQPLKSYCQYVIIDTDIGGDDAQALIYAISQAKKTNKTIIGITCINGNTFLEQVAKNTLIVQALCRTSIPVYLGCSTSLLGTLQKDFYFSADGLGNKQNFYYNHFIQCNRLNPSLIDKSKHASQFIIQSAQKYINNLGIIAIGPLSNLAVAYHLDNTIVQKISVVSIMGGSITGLGIRSFFAAEFNFFLDAHAAKIVVDVRYLNFNNIVMIAFDFVLQFDTKITNSLFKDNSTQKSKFISEVYQHIMKDQNAALCDPIAVVPIFNPQMIHGYYEVAAQVQITGPRTNGCIVFDWFETTNKKKKVKLVSKIDLEKVVGEIQKAYM